MYWEERQGLHSRVGWVFIGRDELLRPIWRSALFVILGAILFGLVQRAMLRLPGGSLLGPRFVVFYVAIDTGLLLESWFLLSVFDRRSFRTLGLWFYRGWVRELLLGAALGGGLITVSVVFLVASGQLAYRGVAAGARESMPHLLGLAGFLFLAAAFEEIAFRGYAFQRLVDSVGKLGAVVAFSAMFGLVHLQNPSATPLSTANTVLAGILLSVAYLKTRALWLPLGLHWAWNFLMGPLFSLPVSGYRLGPQVLRVEVNGPTWLSGGPYGPEGSAILTIVSAAAIVWTWRAKAFSPSEQMEAALKS